MSPPTGLGANSSGSTITNQELLAEKREDPPPRAFIKRHLKYIVKGESISPRAVKSDSRLSE